MNDEEFRALLDLYMVSDPWPLTSEKSNTIRKLLSGEAQERGFDGWVEAYHEMEVGT